MWWIEAESPSKQEYAGRSALAVSSFRNPRSDLSAGFESQFSENVLHVDLGGAFADNERLRNLAITLTRGNQAGDFAFTGSQAAM